MEDNDGDFKLIPVALHPLDGDEEGFGHFDAEEGDHEPILEDVVHELVVFGESGGVYHRIDNQILQLISYLLDNKKLHS